jgi:hypothetical protein
MSSSIRRNAARGAFLAALFQFAAAACDPTAPNDPTDQSKLLDAEVARTIGVSRLTASAVSWFEIDLTWPATAGVTGYQIYRSTTGVAGVYTQLAATTSNAVSFADTGLKGSAQYCYEVRSFKTAGKNTTLSAFSSAACATTPAPPPPPVEAPTETEAVPQATRILIKWKDNSANEDGFRVEKQEYLAVSWDASTVPANSTSTSWTDVPVERQWCFRVTAYNTVATSIPSTLDCTAIPAAPKGLSAIAMDAQSITLSWIDYSRYEDGYRVSRSTQGGPFTDIATLPANSTTYRDVAVTADIPYTYRVEALKDGGYSEASDHATGVVPTTVPAAPTDAAASYSLAPDTWATPKFYLGIAWDDASSNESGFAIEFLASGETDWSVYTDVAANATSFFQLFGFEDYVAPSGCFRVRAFNALGSSEPSPITCVDPTSIVQQIIGGGNVVTGTAAPVSPKRSKKVRGHIAH